LTTNLIIAASESEEHLSQPEIDDILGIALRRDASCRPVLQGRPDAALRRRALFLFAFLP
ncbi:hypothetical protein QWJ41_21525, partial [Nocardioides sp. SOB44]|nr:hypothetical protein [Nocardioides cremeus]